MSLIYNEEQQMLADTAQEFLAARSPVAAQRALRDNQAPLGYAPELWSEICEMGWSAIPFPEALGGLEFGYKGMGAVFEALGRHLSATPMLSSVVLCGSLLQQAGNTEQQQTWLAPIIRGDKRLALAVDEDHRHNPTQLNLQAVLCSDGYRLKGDKVMVLEGIGADGYLVAARTSGQAGEREGISLFILNAELQGLSVTRQSLIDSRNVACLRLDNVVVAADSLLGELDQGGAILEHALDLGRLCLAAELLGASETLFAMTLDYLKTRVQFDVPIGSFQALQHRCAWLYVELELARSTLMAAMAAVDAQADNCAAQISLAKWKIGQVADKVSGEAVQMHGGIGVTDELDVGLYLKRIRVGQASLGDADYHLARYGDLSH